MVKKFSKHTPEQIVRNRDWGAVVKGLVEAGLVSPGHPLESRDVNFEHIMPGRSVNRLVFTRAIDVLGQRIIVGIPNCPGRCSDTSIGGPIVIRIRHLLRSVV